MIQDMLLLCAQSFVHSGGVIIFRQSRRCGVAVGRVIPRSWGGTGSRGGRCRRRTWGKRKGGRRCGAGRRVGKVVGGAQNLCRGGKRGVYGGGRGGPSCGD